VTNFVQLEEFREFQNKPRNPNKTPHKAAANHHWSL